MADSAAPGALRAGLVVGGLTATAVLGPLVGISPAWIVVAVALGLAALSLDAARFGGRGGHVLAEALPGGGARLLRIAVHEAGHGLLAEAEGLPVRRVLVGSLACLRAGLNSNGSTEFASEFVMPFLAMPAAADPGGRAGIGGKSVTAKPVPGEPASGEGSTGEPAEADSEQLLPGGLASGLPAEELRRWSRVLLAGMVAEDLVYGESEGGSDDRALLGRIWGLSGFDVATAQREQRRARREVEQLLSRRRPELEQRAEALVAGAPRLFRRAASRPVADLPTVDPVGTNSVATNSGATNSGAINSVVTNSMAPAPLADRAIPAGSTAMGPSEPDPLP